MKLMLNLKGKEKELRHHKAERSGVCCLPALCVHVYTMYIHHCLGIVCSVSLTMP